MSTDLDLIGLLDGVKATGDGKWTALCPGHDDKSPSLSVRRCPDGTWLVHCFSGCDAVSICRAVGLELADLFPDRRVRLAEHVRGVPRLSAGERLELVEHELTTAALLLDEVCRRQDVSDDEWQRLAQAASRIGKARYA